MTYTQGNVLSQVQNAFVERQHLPREVYNYLLPALRNNDDVIKASNKYYLNNYLEQFGGNLVMFQSSADLSKKFGNKKEPNLESSKGITYDYITSPVNLYIMNRQDFNNFMDKMSKYPWITQNFQKIILIPANFINIDDLESVKTQEDIKGLMTLKTDKLSNEWELKKKI
nr:tail protein [Staphylococcus phage S-CoN_Ph37]